MKHTYPSLLRSSASGFITKSLGAAIALAVNTLLARHLGPEQFGIYALIISITNLGATIALIGQPMVIVKKTASYVASQELMLLRGLIEKSYKWSITGAVPLIIFGIIFAYETQHYSWKTPLLIGLATIPFIVANQIRAAFLRGLNYIVLADVPELILRPTLMLLTLAIAIYLNTIDQYAVPAILLQLMAVIISFIFGRWILYIYSPKELRHIKPKYQSKKWFLDGLSFLWISILSLLEGQISLFLLGTIKGSKDVGLYQAAFQLVTIVIFGLMSVNMTLQPKLATAWATKNKALSQRFVSEASQLSIAIALLTGGMLIIFHDTFLSLFGEEYKEAGTALQILIIGQIFNALAGSCGVVLSMTGHQSDVIRGIIIALIINATLCIFFIPNWGITGAAVAVSAGLVSWNTYMAILAYKRTSLITPLNFYYG